MNVVGDYINVLKSFHEILTRSLAACHFVLGRLREKVVYLGKWQGNEEVRACTSCAMWVLTFLVSRTP